MPKDGVTVKARLNLKIPEDLKDWAKDYAHRNGTDVTKMICDYFRYLRDQERKQEQEYVPQI